MRSWLGLLLLTILLCGCGDDAATPPSAAGSAPVQGQRYRFAVAAPGAEQVLTITSVKPGELGYSVQSFVETAEVGAHPTRPLSLRFTPKPQAKEAKTEVLQLAGASFTCQVEEDRGLRTYTAVEDGRERFPGVVRISEGDTVIFELREIEAP